MFTAVSRGLEKKRIIVYVKDTNQREYLAKTAAGIKADVKVKLLNLVPEDMAGVDVCFHFSHGVSHINHNLFFFSFLTKHVTVIFVSFRGFGSLADPDMV